MVAQTISIQTNQAPVPAPGNAVLTSITVTPPAPANLPVGSTQQFTAMATYSNGTQADVTSQVSWASSIGTVATISSTGLATGVAAGSTLIAASLSGITSAAVTLTVIAAPVATLTSITVTPASASILVGLSQQYNAVAAYSNGTSLNVNSVATWVSSNTTAATISGTGAATGGTAGTTTITASLYGMTSPAVTLTVNAPTLSSITVTPGSPVSLHTGTTQQFAATAGYSNGSNANVSSQKLKGPPTRTNVSSVSSPATISNFRGV